MRSNRVNWRETMVAIVARVRSRLPWGFPRKLAPRHGNAHVLSLIGYWEDEAALPDQRRGWPHPRDLVDSSLDDATCRAVVTHLRNGTAFRAFMGMSRCRLCAKNLGSQELSDGLFAWPEGLDHYVEEHQVRLPEAFVQTCVAPSHHVPGWLKHVNPEVWVQVDHETAAHPGPPSLYVVDETPWLDWAALNTPAYPDPEAISFAAAQDVCMSLSHGSWQARITEVNQRWCLRMSDGGAETRIYMHRCRREVLERRLLRLRRPDPAALMDPQQTRIIAAEYDGTWGAVRVLGATAAAWLVLVKEPSADWPADDELRDVARSMQAGYAVFSKYGRFQAISPLDERAWRWFITSEREARQRVPRAG